MPTKLRKMAFFQSGNLLLRILFNKFRQKRPIGWLGRAQFVTGINLLFTLLLYSRSLARRRRHPAPGTPGFFFNISAKRLLLGPAREGAAGWPHPHRRQRQGGLGREDLQRSVRRLLPAVVRALRIVHTTGGGTICWKKLYNKVCCTTYHSFFYFIFPGLNPTHHSYSNMLRPVWLFGTCSSKQDLYWHDMSMKKLS